MIEQPFLTKERRQALAEFLCSALKCGDRPSVVFDEKSCTINNAALDGDHMTIEVEGVVEFYLSAPITQREFTAKIAMEDLCILNCTPKNARWLFKVILNNRVMSAEYYLHARHEMVCAKMMHYRVGPCFVTVDQKTGDIIGYFYSEQAAILGKLAFADAFEKTATVRYA